VHFAGFAGLSDAGSARRVGHPFFGRETMCAWRHSGTAM
jgi:hypothetical protein